MMDEATAASLALPAVAEPAEPLQPADYPLEQPVMEAEDEKTVPSASDAPAEQPDIINDASTVTNAMPSSMVHYCNHDQFKTDHEDPDVNIQPVTHDPNEPFRVVAEQQANSNHVNNDVPPVFLQHDQNPQPHAQETNHQHVAEATSVCKTDDPLLPTFTAGVSTEQYDVNANVPHRSDQNTQSPAPAGTNQVQDVAAYLISLGRQGDGTSSAIMNGFLPPPGDSGKIITAPTGKQYSMKPRDPKRDTSISFEEMQRLMRVYGPIKCLRNRTPKETGKALKIDSVKRKFYRWFPDFDSRQVSILESLYSLSV